METIRTVDDLDTYDLPDAIAAFAARSPDCLDNSDETERYLCRLEDHLDVALPEDMDNQVIVRVLDITRKAHALVAA
jgi:hypothetical protein